MVIPVKEQVDAVIVLNKGIVYNIKDPRDKLMVEVDGERKLGLVGVELEDKTLMHFLLYLSYVVPCEVRMTPIIRLYTSLGQESVKVV